MRADLSFVGEIAVYQRRHFDHGAAIGQVNGERMSGGLRGAWCRRG